MKTDYLYRNLYPGKRRFNTGFPVLRFGETVTNDRDVYDYTRDTLEFCFRLSSTEETARDRMDGISYQPPFPHLFVKFPGKHYQTKLNGNRNAFFIIYPGELLTPLENTGFFFDPPCFPIKINDELLREMNLLRSFFAHTLEDGVPEMIDAHAMLLLQEAFRQREPDPDSVHPKIHRIASWILLHFTENFELEDIAAKNGMSRRSFYRAWNRCFEMSPARYLLNRKLNHAKNLLQEHPEMPVEEISIQSGFVNTGHFIRMFKREFGKTPFQFRKVSEAD